MILYPDRYMDTTLRCKELAFSFSNTIAVASLVRLELLSAYGIISNELFGSRVRFTGSPGFKCISSIHFFGNDKMYVDLPVNCILRTSPLSDIGLYEFYRSNVYIKYCEI